MSDLLARFARSISSHWIRSLVVALVVLIGIGIFSSTAAEPPPDDFNIPGTESQQAVDLFEEQGSDLGGITANVVFRAESGNLKAGENRQAVEDALAEIGGLDKVAGASDPYAKDPRRRAVSPDGRTAMTTVFYDPDITYGDLEKEDAQDLEDATATLEDQGITVAMRGMVVQRGQEQEAPVGELIGILVAIVLLSLLFRSAAAMIATLVGALIGVMAGQMLLVILSSPLGLPEFASIIAMMLGLGAGIDYSLLILGRYREQAAAGDSTRDAAAKSAATAGASVLAAGLIVVVAIAGLLVIGIPMVGKMGVGAAIGVAAVVVSALTVLPIMIGALQRWLKPKKAAHVQASPGFAAWGRKITARPWLAIVAGVLILLVFASPLVDLRLGNPDDGNQPKDNTVRQAYDLTSEGFGPGVNGPFYIAVDVPQDSATKVEDLKQLNAALSQTDGVASSQLDQIGKKGAVISDNGEFASIQLIPTTSPQDEATSELLDTLRDEVIPEATADTGLQVYVGGETAGFQDFSTKVSDRLPLFIAVVIGLSVLLLMASFRSLWIPLVSAVFNLLSVGAAYGVVVAVFQKGIGASLIGVDSGVPIMSFVPVMIFAILFGLSMDYNVFLLSRVHEAYKEGDSPRESVIHGLSRIGKVIFFAGLIMASVFLAFVTQSDVVAKMMGLGLGLAILIDVLIVRLVIAPAVVMLLGDRAWWLPGWLDRILPNVSLEGHLVANKDPKGKPLLPELAEDPTLEKP